MSLFHDGLGKGILEMAMGQVWVDSIRLDLTHQRLKNSDLLEIQTRLA